MDCRYNSVIEHLSNVQKTMGSIPSSGKKEIKMKKGRRKGREEKKEEGGKEETEDKRRKRWRVLKSQWSWWCRPVIQALWMLK